MAKIYVLTEFFRSGDGSEMANVCGLFASEENGLVAFEKQYEANKEACEDGDDVEETNEPVEDTNVRNNVKYVSHFDEDFVGFTLSLDKVEVGAFDPENALLQLY